MSDPFRLVAGNGVRSLGGIYSFLQSWLIVAFLAAAGDLARASQPEIDVFGRLKSIASAERDLAEANLERSQQRLTSFQHLHEIGHASYLELNRAKFRHADTQTQFEACDRLLHFVDQLSHAASNPDNQLDDTPLSPRVSVLIDSLAQEPQTCLLSSIVFSRPLDESWQVISRLQSDLAAVIEKKHQVRDRAWSDLITRLKSIGDSSAVIGKEIEFAKCDRQIAAAQQRIATLFAASAHEFPSIRPFRFQGSVVATSADAMVLFHAQSDRMEMVALQESSARQRELLMELEARVAKADRVGASPARELPTIQRKIASLELRQLIATDRLAEIDGMEKPAIDAPTQFVSIRDIADPTHHEGHHAVSIQLESAMDATLDRLVEAANWVDIAGARHHRIADHALQISRLAETDAAMANESHGVNLRAAVARADFEWAVHQHQLRILENEYAEAIVKAAHARSTGATDDRLSWQRPLKKWFRLRATANEAVQLARCELALNQWRLAGTQALRSSGASTWKELVAAQVRVDESEAQIEKAGMEMKWAQQILNQLDSDGGFQPAVLLDAMK